MNADIGMGFGAGDQYGYTKAEAKRAEDDGLPAVLPDGNRWKAGALAHRYGHHFAGCPTGCPQFGTDAATPAL